MIHIDFGKALPYSQLASEKRGGSVAKVTGFAENEIFGSLIAERGAVAIKFLAIFANRRGFSRCLSAGVDELWAALSVDVDCQNAVHFTHPKSVFVKRSPVALNAAPAVCSRARIEPSLLKVRSLRVRLQIRRSRLTERKTFGEPSRALRAERLDKFPAFRRLVNRHTLFAPYR
jgi:hypothetical protein